MRRLTAGRTATPTARGDEPAEDEDEDDVEPGKGGRELVRRVGADRHEAAGAERDLAAIADQQVEADRGEREDQERDQDRPQPVLAEPTAGTTRKATASAASTTDQRSWRIGKIAWSAA